MTKVKVYWDPKGREIDSLGTKEFLRITDGDTPYVSMSIRMLSVDTPEVHYPGNQRPAKHDEKLAQLAEWIKEGKAPIRAGLANYLYARLATGQAGTLQQEQGYEATAYFQAVLDEKLTRPSGSRRRVYLSSADQPFDQYGRILAYLSPYYSSKEREHLSLKERATFNLLMIDAGWAASFPIFPSIPKYSDLILLREMGEDAFRQQRGVWQNSVTLTGYEFRMCVKLHRITEALVVGGERLSASRRSSWISRYCVDMTTLEIFEPQDYYVVAPYNRIFIWPNDVGGAVGKMNLIPGDPR